MYIPTDFKNTDLKELHEHMGKWSFITLITPAGQTSHITHVPVLVDPKSEEFGVITGHFAEQNPHWKYLKSETESIAIFHGPHAYISPTWYAKPDVPTWNYSVIHAHGPVEIIRDKNLLLDQQKELIAKFENNDYDNWDISKLSEEYIDTLLGMIVGFKLTITKLEGKYKLGQNRRKSDMEGVIDQLKSSPIASDVELASLTEKHLKD
jgi:transcriptional regulator